MSFRQHSKELPLVYNHLYQNIDSKYEFTHLETTYKIIRMSDGRMAIRCYPVVEVANSETDVSFEDILDLLIYLKNK